MHKRETFSNRILFLFDTHLFMITLKTDNAFEKAFFHFHFFQTFIQKIIFASTSQLQLLRP